MMKVHVMMYNMQGLCGPDRLAKLKIFINNFRPSIDILCGQEHHLRGSRLGMILLQLWRDAEFFIILAQDGAIVERNPKANSRKGGIFITVGTKLSPYITNKGILPSERGAWMKFDHPTHGKFGVINIYAPTREEAAKCISLWQELVSNFNNETPWILTRDFNMIEHLSNQEGSNPHCVTRREGRAWTHLKRKFKMEDTFVRHQGQLRFTWRNWRRITPGHAAKRILRRLDRCYAPINSPNLKFAMMSHIIGGSTYLTTTL